MTAASEGSTAPSLTGSTTRVLSSTAPTGPVSLQPGPGARLATSPFDAMGSSSSPSPHSSSGRQSVAFTVTATSQRVLRC